MTPERGRFGAKPVPVERLTLKEIRRPSSGEGDTVPRTYHITELGDAGTPVRLAAASAHLDRLLRELGLAEGVTR